MISFRKTLDDIIHDLPKSDFFIKALISNYLYNPRFRLLLNHRIGKYFFFSKFFLIRQIGIYYKSRMVVKRGCDFSYNSHIGRNLRMPHPIGIVIGDGVVIEDDVMIFQQVTLGSHGKKGVAMSYPLIKSGTRIYAGAKVIGGVIVNENSIIGANSVVNIDVPEGSTAIGIPCKIIKK